jgi:Trehalase
MTHRQSPMTLIEIDRRSLLMLAGASAGLSALSPLVAHAQPAPAPPAAAAGTSPASRRDMPLPDWGPYSPSLYGLSHIADAERGLRMDFALVPAIVHNEAIVPRPGKDVPVMPLRADPELGYVAFEYRLSGGLRVELEWARHDERTYVLRATAVNNGPAPLPLALSWVARLTPPGEANGPRVRIELPEGAAWVNALDYTTLDFARPRRDDALVYDGQRRGELLGATLVGRKGIGGGRFGADAGDRVAWQLPLGQPLRAAVLRLRYRVAGDTPAQLRLGGLVQASLSLPATGGEFRFADVDVGALKPGLQDLTLTSQGTAPFELNGLALLERADLDRLRLHQDRWPLKPERSDGVDELTLDFAAAQGPAYGLRWSGGTAFVRDGAALELKASSFANFSPNSNANAMPQGGSGHHTAITPRLMTIAPGEVQRRELVIAQGRRADIPGRLAAAARLDVGAVLQAGRARCPALGQAPDQQPHTEGQARMFATLATNVSFPVWTGNRHVRHYTPGKLWPAVYTWDAGFIGLGLAQASTRLGTAALDAYLTPADDPQAAFLHHGSPLPVQLYLFQELWNRHDEPAKFAAERYASLARYHRFLMGRVPGSTCRDLGSGLLRTFDYFYNSGGWDDYPAQLAMHAQGLAGRMAPVVNSAHAIRFAKLLRQLADALGHHADLAEWQADIDSLSAALQTNCWDEAAGYFGYLLHDAAKQPVGIWRTPAGENYNRGMDGASPLVADITTPAQTARLVEALMTPGRMWTNAGISVVDQSASYASATGYWNGAVWMPHQWFVWKALLDHGLPQHAHRIAGNALRVWNQEIAATGRCCEVFDNVAEKGGGWHPFGALSSPVVMWYRAYHAPGTLSVGLNARVLSQQWSADRSRLAAELQLDGQPGRSSAVLVALAGAPQRARWNGEPVDVQRIGARVAQVSLPSSARGRLEVA